MKKYLLITLVLACIFSSCEKKDSGRLDSNAEVKITGQEQRSKSVGERIHGTHCTDSIAFISRYAYAWSCWNTHDNWDVLYGLGIIREYYEMCQDTINNKIFWWGTGVVTESGELGEYIMYTKDLVFIVAIDEKMDKVLFPWEVKGEIYPSWEGVRFDTIAYIPNSLLLKARQQITEALGREDYTECYRLFDEAFVYIPITGEKWRALKAAGVE